MIKELWPWVRLSLRRDRFLKERMGTNLSDELFFESVCATCSEFERRIMGVLRRVIAQECGVVPEIILPNDSNQLLDSLMGSEGFLGWLLGGPYKYYYPSAFRGVLFGLQSEFGSPPPLKMNELPSLSSFVRREGDLEISPTRFSDWIFRATQELKTVLERSGYGVN